MVITDFLKQAAHDGFIVCPVCENRIEPDCEKCGECGWKNPLVSGGLI